MVAATLSALLVELRHLGAGHDLDALLLEALAGEGRDLGVLDRQDLRQHLDHRHLGAEACGRSEANSMPIAPEPTTSSDFGMRLRHHRLEIGPDQLAVRLQARQHARPRAGGEDDVLGLIGAGAERALRRVALRRPSP